MSTNLHPSVEKAARARLQEMTSLKLERRDLWPGWTAAILLMLNTEPAALDQLIGMVKASAVLGGDEKMAELVEAAKEGRLFGVTQIQTVDESAQETSPTSGTKGARRGGPKRGGTALKASSS